MRRLAVVIVAVTTLACASTKQVLPSKDGSALGAEYFYRLVRGYGFTPLKFPSALYPPGTVIRIENTGTFVDCVPVCFEDESLGPNVAPRKRKAPEYEAKFDGSFEINAEYVSLLRALHEQVKTVRFSLRNVESWQLSRSMVDERFVERKPSCTRQIALSLGRDEQLTLITTVLKGDGVFTISYGDEKLGDETKVEILKTLSQKLGLDAAVQIRSSRELIAKDLFWGIKEDATLVEPYDGAEAERPKQHARLFTSGLVRPELMLEEVGAQRKVSIVEHSKHVVLSGRVTSRAQRAQIVLALRNLCAKPVLNKAQIGN
jgi:hypothetical protein